MATPRKPEGVWSTKFSECQNCGMTDSPHVSRGNCKRCDARMRYAAVRVHYPQVVYRSDDHLFKIDRTGIPKALRERLEWGEQ